MPVASDRILRVTAHGRSYQMRENIDPTAGKAAATISRRMRLGEPYERPLLEHIYQLGLDGVAVDVGANVGNHTLWLAAICGFYVVAFEPLMWRELRSNVQLNRLERDVQVVPYALGDHAGTARHVGDGMLKLDGDAQISVQPLDSFGVFGVTLMKVDVEGMEPLVLRGAEATIRRDRPVIFAEEWDDHPRWHDDIAAVLEPWGYTMAHRFSGRGAATPVGKWEHPG